jgi:hypothetical protein
MNNFELKAKVLDHLGNIGNGVLSTRCICNLIFGQVTKGGYRIIPGPDKMGDTYRALRQMKQRGLVLQVAPTLWKLVK